MLLLNFLLTIAWTALTGDFSPRNFITGFVVVYLILVLTEVAMGRRSGYLRRMWLVIAFSLFFLKELTISTLRVTRWVLSPQLTMRPAVIAIPLDITTDAQITLLGNLITLTPGTLTLDVSGDHRFIYVHVIDVQDVEAFRQDVKNGFERRILEVWDAWT